MAELTASLCDITTLDVDAIVNAANEQLWAGAGVCGAIHEAAGPELEEACNLLAPCPTGDARITPGFHLPARYVIHAVGPRWSGDRDGDGALLTSAYRAALRLADAHECRSIAFPAIGTGIYGFPLEPAAAIAVRTVAEAVGRGTSLTEVIFACYDERTLASYRALGIAVRER